MPRLEDRHESNDWSDELDNARHRFGASISSVWESFTNFALRDNVLEVAVGLIFAAAFTAVANSLVTDIILPLISLLPFLSRNLDEKFLILRHSPHPKYLHYNTVQQALDDGALVWAWGNFIDKVLRFFLIAAALFTVARAYAWMSGEQVVKRQVKCRYCRKYISEKARRCVNCTSWLDGREDQNDATSG